MAVSESPLSGFVDKLTQSLRGLPVSLVWKGYGATIFLELGRLTPIENDERHANGEACIWLQWYWRVEEGASVRFGSSNSRPYIASEIKQLEGTTLSHLELTGTVPELLLVLSNGMLIRSMAMRDGDPQWLIRLQSGEYIHPRDGALLVNSGEDPDILTEGEEEEMERLEETAKRWGKPRVEPAGGDCRDCHHYERLDSEGHLLDYGVCASALSPLDGRAVCCSSGCPAFEALR
jgi:hypothetical protein